MKNSTRHFIIFALLSILNVTGLKAQTETYQAKQSGISLGLVGYVPGIGLNFDNFVTKNISAGVSIGITGVGIEAKYHFANLNSNRFKFYAGLSFLSFYEAVPAYYTPIGISYTGKKNFQYSLDGGVFYSEMADPVLGPNFNLRAGYRFGESISETGFEKEASKKNIISLTAGFPIVVLLSYERLLLPWLGAEAGIGALSAAGGIRLYTPGLYNKSFGFHAGIVHIFSSYIEPATLVTIGPHYLSKRGIRISADAVPGWKEPNNPDGLSFIGASMSLGVVF